MAFLQSYLLRTNVRNLMCYWGALPSIVNPTEDLFCIQKRYAARKGKRIAATREKQRLARIRREEMKNAPPKVWKPLKLQMDKNLKGVSKKFSDADRRELSEIVDNVYIIEHYKERKLPLKEVLAAIRETHHPTMYGESNALVEAKVELDLRTKKKTKFVERFRGIVSYPNLFAYGIKRKVVAVCKSEEDEAAAKSAGAELAGCADIIRMLKVGDITLDNFDELVCHGDMLIELAAIRTTVGSFFPTKQRGNIGFDMHRLVSHFVNGHEFKLHKEDYEPDYGFIKMPVGRLEQTDQELEENLETLLKTVEENQPAGAPGDFITRVLLLSEPSPESFPLAFWDHVEGYEKPGLDEENEEKPEAQKIAQK